MSDIRKIIIDGKEVEVEGAMTLIQACEQVGVEVAAHEVLPDGSVE